MLFDTDVLIWALRGHERAARVLDAADVRLVSIVSRMELVQGARNREELPLIRAYLDDLAFETLPLTENIGHRALVYLEEHSLKSGLTVGDALVAATAVEAGAPLCTGNHRHFRVIAGLQVALFRP
jgi:hypothetical protein